MMNISDILAPGHILLDQSAASHDALLDLLAQAASALLGLPASGIREALRAREELGTTGIGGGIAIPHASLRGLGRPFLMPVRLRKPVHVRAVDDAPVDLVFLCLFPINDQASALKLMSAVTRRLRDGDVVATLRKAAAPEEVFSTLTRSPES